MAFTMNKICRACKLKDRCDEDALMRSYVTSADESGCPKYKSILDMEESDDGFAQMMAESAAQDERRRQMEEELDRKYREEKLAEFKQENEDYQVALVNEFTNLAVVLDDLAKSCGPEEPTPEMDYKSYSAAYSAWSLKRKMFEMSPIHSELAQEYLQFLDDYTDTKKEKEMALRQDHSLNNFRLSYVDGVLEKYRNYGISGEGAKNEEIHQYALERQKQYDEKIAAQKVEEERKAEEERKRIEEEAQKKAEIKRQKDEEKKRKAKEKAERKKIEEEQDRKNKEVEKKKAQIFWIAWAASAFILFISVEEWWAYVLVVLALIAAIAIRWIIKLFK